MFSKVRHSLCALSTLREAEKANEAHLTDVLAVALLCIDLIFGGGRTERCCDLPKKVCLKRNVSEWTSFSTNLVLGSVFCHIGIFSLLLLLKTT